MAVRVGRWPGNLRHLLNAGLQAKEDMMRPACTGSQTRLPDHLSLDDLLADDVTQAMMQADGVSPALVRELFAKVARRDRPRAARPFSHRLPALRRHAPNYLLACRFPAGPGGPCLQSILLVISAAVAWCTVGRT